MKNNKNINKERIMLMSDIDMIFTQKLNELLSKGLRIHTLPMGGSQGDRARIYLTNGKDVYQLSIKTGTMEIDGYLDIADTIEITLEKHENKIHHSTLWIDEGEIIEKIIYYKIGRNKHDNVYGTLEQYKSLMDKKYKRYYSKEVKIYKEIKLTEKVLNILKNHKGYKRIKLDEVETIIKDNRGYTISIKNKKSIWIGFPIKYNY